MGLRWPQAPSPPPSEPARGPLAPACSSPFTLAGMLFSTKLLRRLSSPEADNYENSSVYRAQDEFAALVLQVLQSEGLAITRSHPAFLLFTALRFWIVPPPNPRWRADGLDVAAEAVLVSWPQWPEVLPLEFEHRPWTTAGFDPDAAFSTEEYFKLEDYISPASPCFFTDGLIFPFLMSQVITVHPDAPQSSQAAVGAAHLHDATAGYLAAVAIIKLFERAYGSQAPETLALYGVPLAFSVVYTHRCPYTHNAAALARKLGGGGGTAGGTAGGMGGSGEVQLFAHCVSRAAPHEPARQYLGGCRLAAATPERARDVVAYNFVRNIYRDFVPAHLARIKGALARLPEAQYANSLDDDDDDADDDDQEEDEEDEDDEDDDDDNYDYEEADAETSLDSPI